MSELFERLDKLGLDAARLAIVGSVLLGLAAAWLAWSIIAVACRPIPGDPSTWDYEQRRRNLLRQGNKIFRWCEPLVDEWIEMFGLGESAEFSQLQQNLITAAGPLPWKPDEFWATAWIEGLLTALAIILLGSELFGLPLAALASIACAWFYPRLKVKDVASQAARRKKSIRRRLPFGLDLLALMMEAGASFLDGVKTVAREFAGEGLGQELERVLSELALGRTRREALQALQERVRDEDLSEMVFAIIKGEELGTPLSQVFRLQAEQMRLKRSQWAEKAAGDAQVMIVFPGMVTMVACLLVVIAPFVFGAFNSAK